jgi:hypothetical protein
VPWPYLFSPGNPGERDIPISLRTSSATDDLASFNHQAGSRGTAKFEWFASKNLQVAPWQKRTRANW